MRSRADLGFFAATTLLLTLAGFQWMAGRGDAPYEAASLAVGMQLPPVNVQVLSMDNGDLRQSGNTSIREVFGGSCGVAVFFQSSCPALGSVIGEWEARDTVQSADGLDIPVAWITMVGDREAAALVINHALPTPVFAVQSLDDLGSLGVQIWPTAYVVGPNGVIAGMPSIATPDAVGAIKDRCIR